MVNKFQVSPKWSIRTSIKNSFIFIFTLLFCTSYIFGQFDYGFDFSKAGTAGFQFLKIGVGARESALGEAYGPLSHDVNSVFWNVAGLGHVDKFQMTCSHTEWLVESTHDAFAIALPVKSFVVGLSGISFKIEDFEETTVLEPNGTGRMVGAGDYLIGLSIARRFTNKLSIGGQVKYIQEVLDEDSFGNILFDIGTIYNTGFHYLRLAFALQHFGPDMRMFDQTFRTPLLFRVGAADDIFNTNLNRLTASVELIHPTDANEWVNFGMEYEFLKLIALRTGYRLNIDEGQLTFGFGLNTPQVKNLGMKFDYAYNSFGDIFGATHRFSIGLAF
jgi:hypothetical protein